MRAPVALFAFNRPDTLARVFAAVRAARPPRLLLVCDGPRPGYPDDAARCAAVREILAQVDWPCAVLRNYAEENLGCRKRISSGVSWAFSHAEEAVFLEDDTLPDASFFRFCDELLERYRNEPRVLMISGYNLLGHGNGDDSYWFSSHPRVWGWASWRRSWSGYDVTMSEWPAFKHTAAWTARSRAEHGVWEPFFDAVKAGVVDTWDAQLTIHAWRNGALTAIPEKNLVANIGFGTDSTNTRASSDPAPAPQPLEFPLRHPAAVARKRRLDAKWVELEHPRPPGLLRRAARRLLRLISRSE